MPSSRSSFTLIELLIVVAIVAVLAVVVILTLQPAELLRQSRDSNRLSDMDTLNKALALYQTDVAGGSLGTANKVYVSVPDTTSTCANLGLPALPSGWSYACASTSTYTNVDGTGWLPVNLSALSAGAPLSRLPIDPTNSTSSNLFYTYVPSSTSATYELASVFESQKYTNNAGVDGGTDPAMYEKGSDLTIAPFTHGMVGYWKFDGDYTDSSGYGRSGTGAGGVSFVTGQRSQAVSFDGVNGRVSLSCSSDFVATTRGITISAWVYQNGYTAQFRRFIELGFASSPFLQWSLQQSSASGGIRWYVVNSGATGGPISGTASINGWHFITGVWNGSTYQLFVDGVSQSSGSLSGVGPTCGYGLYFGGTPVSGGTDTNAAFNGYIDDARIYNRALSAAEVAAIYNATK